MQVRDCYVVMTNRKLELCCSITVMQKRIFQRKKMIMNIMARHAVQQHEGSHKNL